MEEPCNPKTVLNGFIDDDEDPHHDGVMERIAAFGTDIIIKASIERILQVEVQFGRAVNRGDRLTEIHNRASERVQLRASEVFDQAPALTI